MHRMRRVTALLLIGCPLLLALAVGARLNCKDYHEDGKGGTPPGDAGIDPGNVRFPLRYLDSCLSSESIDSRDAWRYLSDGRVALDSEEVTALESRAERGEDLLLAGMVFRSLGRGEEFAELVAGLPDSVRRHKRMVALVLCGSPACRDALVRLGQRSEDDARSLAMALGHARGTWARDMLRAIREGELGLDATGVMRQFVTEYATVSLLQWGTRDAIDAAQADPEGVVAGQISLMVIQGMRLPDPVIRKDVVDLLAERRDFQAALAVAENDRDYDASVLVLRECSEWELWSAMTLFRPSPDPMFVTWMLENVSNKEVAAHLRAFREEAAQHDCFQGRTRDDLLAYLDEKGDARPEWSDRLNCFVFGKRDEASD